MHHLVTSLILGISLLLLYERPAFDKSILKRLEHNRSEHFKRTRTVVLRDYLERMAIPYKMNEEGAPVQVKIAGRELVVMGISLQPLPSDGEKGDKAAYPRNQILLETTEGPVVLGTV